MVDAPHYRFPLKFLPDIEVPRAPDYLIQGLLPANELSVLYGRPGCGKSFLALDAALHIAAGRAWAGRKVRAGGVVYVASEAARGMLKRIVASLGHHGLDRTLPFALLTIAPDLGQRESDADGLADEILAQIPPSFDPQLIILDTLARSMVGGDESGSASMGIFVENAGRLAKKLGAAILVIHHMGKDRLRGMRGSSALLGAIEALWKIDPEEPGVVRVAKMKDDADGLVIPFRLTRVVIGSNTDGDPITTCVVTVNTAATAPPRETARDSVEEGERDDPNEDAQDLTSSTEAFLTAVQQLVDRHGVPYGRSRHVPTNIKTMMQSELSVHAVALGVTGASSKSRRSTIDRHIRALIETGIVQRHGGRIWLAAAAC